MAVNIAHMDLSIKSSLIILLVFCACSSGVKNGDAPLANLKWEEEPNLWATNFAIQKSGSAHTRLLIFKDNTRKDTLTKLYKGNLKLTESSYITISDSVAIASLSSTYVGFIDAINQAHKIKYVDETDYISSNRVRKLINNKKILECGSGDQINFELLMEDKPLVLSYEVEGNSSSLINRLKKLAIPVMNCTDFKEAHPLGRAEWIKVFGFLCNRASDATMLFNEIVEHYEQTQYFCIRLKEKPTVFSGNLFGGEWNVSGGKSFLAQMIKDAGGIYLYANDTLKLNLVYSFENVFQKCKSAEVWLNPNVYKKKSDLIAEDIRYALFSAFNEGSIYNNNKMTNDFGGNAFWEMGVVRPDLVLLDLAKCLHPFYFEGQTTTFYQQLE